MTDETYNFALPADAFRPLPDGAFMPYLPDWQCQGLGLPGLKRTVLGDHSNHTAQAEMCIRLLAAYPDGSGRQAISRSVFLRRLAIESLCGYEHGPGHCHEQCVDGSIAQHSQTGFLRLGAALEQLIAASLVFTDKFGELLWPSATLIDLLAYTDEAAA